MDDVVDVIPTAVATVYEEKENVVTINASASDPPNSTASSTDEKQDVTAKPVKVQVWMDRFMNPLGKCKWLS